MVQPAGRSEANGLFDPREPKPAIISEIYALLLRPITESFLSKPGIQSVIRALKLGCCAGDASFLVASSESEGFFVD
jgi:hypothetical protein